MNGPGVEQMAQSAPTPTPAPGKTPTPASDTAEGKDPSHPEGQEAESKKSSPDATSSPLEDLPEKGMGKTKPKKGDPTDPDFWKGIYDASGKEKSSDKSAPSPLGDSPKPSPSPAMTMSASPSMDSLPASGQMAGGPSQAQMGQAMQFAAENPELVEAAMTMGS